MLPPKPPARAEKVSVWGYIKLFRRDVLSANPARLYRAKMAEFRTPFFTSYLVNEPALWKLVINERPQDFPKSGRMRAGLEPVMGRSVFVSNGADWERQRRIIDPAFEGGRLRYSFPAILAAARAAVERLGQGGRIEVEERMSHAAADVIFRALFSLPIGTTEASAVFHAFRAHQATQPLLNLAGFLPLPRWFPRFHRRSTLKTARRIRALITAMTERRAAEIAAGTAPDDLATKIMTTADPLTGQRFNTKEMVDQVATFFLAGHETSASALAWTLYLIALDPALQARLAAEADAVLGAAPDFSAVSRLRLARDVFREALRLYPPLPMLVREAAQPECFRGRAVKPGAQIVVSPWHLGRHKDLWQDPDAFCPARWQTPEGRASAREGFIPFSSGPRACTGAGFAMVEGPLILAMLAQRFTFTPVEGRLPVPVAFLTVRARDGIWLDIAPRTPA
ncbi:cytochrome P450 [Pararhodobacter sp.]|uniref:cytochrome P450 n=1 Tax=Pararhodobacter sp. TaxID=2127056 RepID=UPI003FA78F9D